MSIFLRGHPFRMYNFFEQKIAKMVQKMSFERNLVQTREFSNLLALIKLLVQVQQTV